MGAVKSITNRFTYNEYLYFYINKKDQAQVQSILKIRPNLINDPLTVDSKVTALNQAVQTNNISMVDLLIDRYQADINLPSERGETPLIVAIKRNHIEMVKHLVKKGANPNYVHSNGLTTLDFAILQGLYEICHCLFPKIDDRELKAPEIFKEIAQQFHYRYVNYQIFLEELKEMKEPSQTRDFLKIRRTILSDPVIDPNQTWKQWFARNIEFKDPPLVERNSLPEHLRPENRKFGKFGNFLSRMTMTPGSQKPQYKPNTQSELYESTQSKFNKMMIQRVEETQSVS